VRSAVYENEITLYTDITRQSPNKAPPYNNLEEAFRQAGRMDEAMRCFETAIAIDPDYVDALNNLATIYKFRGNREQALALDPRHLQARFNLAMYHYEAGLVFDAEQEFRMLIRTIRTAEKLYSRGRCSV
jgi:tetratricopeptide (TPR) repeat protein